MTGTASPSWNPRHFEWHAGVLTVHGARRTLVSPAHGLGTSTGVKRHTSQPLLLCAGCHLSGGLLRVDVHPADFDHPGHVAVLDHVLSARRAGCITYDELLS